MNRQEHLEWCKSRALKYVDRDDCRNAWMSMASDLQKHKELKNHAAIELGMMMVMSGHLSTSQKIREFIEGFN